MLTSAGDIEDEDRQVTAKTARIINQKYVIIDPSNYTGTDPVVLNVLEEYWLIDSYWTTHFLTLILLGLTTLIYYLNSAPPLDEIAADSIYAPSILEKI